MKNKVLWAQFLILLGSSLAHAFEPAEKRTGFDFSEFEKIPVHSGGRIKPLDSLARDYVLFQTGSRSYQGWNSAELILSWLSFPKEWGSRSFIQVSREDVRRQLGIDEKRSRFSPDEILQQSHLAKYAQELGRSQMGGPAGQVGPVSSKPDARDQELRRLLDRIGVYRNVVSGEGWPLVPIADPNPWLALASPSNEAAPVRDRFAEVVRSYQAGDSQRFIDASRALRITVEGMVPALTPSVRRTLAAESVYNRSRPFMWSWILYLCAALTWATSFSIPSPKSRLVVRAAWTLTFLGLFAQVFGIAIRCYIAGRPPVTNMYESINWVMLGVMIFSLIIYSFQRQLILPAVSTAVATLGLIAGDAAPALMDPSIQPLVPVLRSNYWLTIHVLTITLGYAAFALSLGLSNVTLFHFIKRSSSQKIANMNQLTYRAMQFGVVLLAAGTILGGVWADYSWGRFWGWDPKEVWALIALLGYLAILHARLTGWIGQFGFAVWTAVSFLLVIMAWYGVNFVLGVGLHSYGFSNGGRGGVSAFVLAQMAYVGYAVWARKRGAGQLSKPNQS